MRVIKVTVLLASALLAFAAKSEADKFAILNDHARENLLHSHFSVGEKFARFNEHFDIAEEMASRHRRGLEFQNLPPNQEGISNRREIGIDFVERYLSPNDGLANVHMMNSLISASDTIISHEFLLAVAVGSIFVGVLLGLVLTQEIKKRIREGNNQSEIR
jgi:uncharacterized protein YtpQ (UPF0354 family)